MILNLGAFQCVPHSILCQASLTLIKFERYIYIFSNFNQISVYISSLICNEISVSFCTFQDSRAVLVCAKFHCDPSIWCCEIMSVMIVIKCGILAECLLVRWCHIQPGCLFPWLKAGTDVTINYLTVHSPGLVTSVRLSLGLWGIASNWLLTMCVWFVGNK